MQERNFDIDPVHGALGCLHCVRCVTGFYSAHYTYENCMPCTDCQKEGRHQNRPCSLTQDTVCGNFLEGRCVNSLLKVIRYLRWYHTIQVKFDLLV